jgi:hypothetical protein
MARLTTAASVTCGSTRHQFVSCFSAARDSHGSSPSSHRIGDLFCGIIINHLTVHMCSIQHGLTSAIPLPRLLVMTAFAFFVLPSHTTSTANYAVDILRGTMISQQCHLWTKKPCSGQLEHITVLYLGKHALSFLYTILLMFKNKEDV